MELKQYCFLLYLYLRFKRELYAPRAADTDVRHIMSFRTVASMQQQIGRHARQVGDIVSTQGVAGVVDRVRSRLSTWLKPKASVWDVLPEDVLKADLAHPPSILSLALDDGAPISINWVTGPAGPGSGGHTTLFRIMNYLERQGYSNRLYFYDTYGGDHRYYERITRDHYGVTCPIQKFSSGMRDAHAVMATGWPSAYAIFNSRCKGKRFYFVQDYEPSFYAVGTKSALAENTYRMGFHGITAGRWLAEKLHREFGMAADWFPFGCDTTRYHFDQSSIRRGVAFYARVGTPRRAVELGLLALELFASRHPEVDLHLFGEDLGRLPFRYVNHGVVSPAVLAGIYNKCLAGLSLSLTNVSLVPYEMLACGCIPVVNDAEQNRLVLDNPYIRYAQLSPHALANALHEVVTMPAFDEFAKRAAKSTNAASWDTAGASVDLALRGALAAERSEAFAGSIAARR